MQSLHENSILQLPSAAELDVEDRRADVYVPPKVHAMPYGNLHYYYQKLVAISCNCIR